MKTAVYEEILIESGRRSIVLVLSIAIFLCAAVLRVGMLDIAPEFDELYHLLAARSWIADGSLSILDGEYTRGRYFTQSIAAVMGVFGDDLTTGRLPNVVVGSMIPVVVFLWANRVAGLAVAVIVAAFAVVWPQGIVEAQTLRFYAPQVLTYTVGAMAIYLAISPAPVNRLLWGLVALVVWAAALHLQITSIVGIGAAVGAAVMIVLFDRITSLRGRVATVIIVAAVMLAVLAIAYLTGILAKAIEFYRWTPAHADRLRDYHSFYHHQMERVYGLLWWTSPIWALIALWAKPRVAFFALTVFFTCFLAHSFAGMKSLRYMSYALPMMWVIWAIAAVWIWTQIAGRIGPKVASGVAAAAVIGVVFVTGFVGEAARFAQGTDYRPREDWSAVRETIADWNDAPFVATSRELHMAAFVSDFDLIISRSRLSELTPADEFTADFRTGRVTIGSEEAVAAVLACHRDGLMLAPEEWLIKSEEGEAFQALLIAAGLETETRTTADVFAIRWTDPNDVAPDWSGDRTTRMPLSPPAPQNNPARRHSDL
ncbi:MAG: hypothetical protein AAFP98_06945, partial [Pseudomonadota bacterium]